MPRFEGGETDSEGGGVAPPRTDTGSSEPVASTPTVFSMRIDGVVASAGSVSWMLATTPLDIAFMFKPVRMQVNKPGVELHERVFPAAVAAGPAVAPIAEI